MNKSAPPLNHFVAMVLLFFFTAPVSAYIYAWAAQTMWQWFCGKQYGPGPSMPAWYGIFAVVGLMLVGVKGRKIYDTETPISSIMIEAAFAAVIVVCTVLSGLVVHAWFGWGQ